MDMLVHFSATANNLDENIESLRAVVKILKEKGHTLTRDWVEDAYERKQKSTNVDDSKWHTFIREDFEGIAKADVVIAEVSYDSTAVGYQIATAIQQKKPTLLILEEGRKVPPFTWNIPSDFLSKVEYNQKNLSSKITPFLEQNDITTKDMRFNFFIDRAIYNYLRWAALRTGKTKAEILRELVQREIKEKDY
jgi:hypothetical protein